MLLRMRTWTAVLIAVLSFPAAAETRFYAGQFATHWKTRGFHGHDQPCLFTPDCDPDDFARANLDNSIGFRLGAEREYASFRALRLVGGIDVSFTDTEYNISQNDLNVVAGAVAAGFDADLWRAELSARVGAGPFVTSDVTAGALLYGELALTLPLTSGVGVRVSVRETSMKPLLEGQLDLDNSSEPAASLRTRDVSLLFVTMPAARADSRWEFIAGSGMSSPRDLELSNALFTRLSVQRTLTRSLQAQLSWTSSAHESEVPGVFMGFGGNFRSKTIDAFGVSLRGTRTLSPAFAAFAHVGAEGADWSDEHGLLIGSGGEGVEGRFELGLGAGAGIRYRLRERLALETFVEHVWWPRIDLRELRIGLVLAVR